MSPEARTILRHTLAGNLRRKHWGSRNSWVASATPSPPLAELINAGYIVPGHAMGGDSVNYRATPAGMRAAGLGPQAIERACAL